MKYKTLFISLCVAVVIIALALFLGQNALFAAPQNSGSSATATTQFTIPLTSNATSTTLTMLRSQGFIKSEFGFGITLLLKGKSTSDIQAGGYELSPTMNAWQVAATLTAPPALRWVVIPPGLRKEQIADILASALNWTTAEKEEWITTDTTQSADYTEGVYFPDTYLIPVTDTPAATANRLRAQFASSFAPYAQEALQQNIKWTTALKIASLIQREAGSTSDMPLISGIIWNRLLANMSLGIDATVQYAQGTEGNWWPPLTTADTQIPSPYNTYLHAGLPPTPIDNPGVDAISAALNPASTTCFYYLYDSTGTIHCADTYAEHQANVKKYLQ